LAPFLFPKGGDQNEKAKASKGKNCKESKARHLVYGQSPKGLDLHEPGFKVANSSVKKQNI
jgi:hypothetical protein